jgi:alpha-beta hydrolase superfamily lysophospholipase
VKHQEGYLKGVRDTRIYYQHWLPEEETKAVLLLVHGLAEHSGRYMNVVNHFVPSAYAVYAFDHIGHGNSDGERVYVERFRDYTNPLNIYVRMIHEWQHGKPLFAIGHSMGGLILASYLLEHQHEFSGAVFSGPGVKVPDNISRTVIFMGRILSRLFPKAGILQLDSKGVSRDPAVVDAYVNDPMVYTGKITARLGAEMLEAMQNVMDNAGQIKLPLTIVQGSDDILIDPGGAQRLYDSVGSKDKSIKFYQGCYHEVFNEPEHKMVLNDVQKWLETHLGAT